MDENEMYMKLSDKIDKLIDKLDNKFDAFDQKLHNHETRLVVLEVHDKSEHNDWKSQLLMLLAKAVVIGGVTIASLAGAGGILAKMGIGA